ncbi:hypothetical protein GHT06_015256 [Daphnia sinensis]|uniref:Uncharacterized protein n=1 Tax=Daphnia sinensis TaxID=1820382 RepID=A0AAD5KQW4_9CRUS|nr:hypothetical protein GHT06_015256 [Daphnia sinensis]
MRMETMDTVGCDWLLNDLGPPPDAILRIPPPPLPHFIDRAYLHEMALAAAGDINHENDTVLAAPCHWCHWARRFDLVGSVSVTSGTEMALEDTWFFVILASCLMLTLGAFLSALIYLRLNGKMLKGAWDFGSFLTENGSILIGGNDSGVSHIGSERHHNTGAMMSVRTVAGHQADNSKLDCQTIGSSGDREDDFRRNCSRGSVAPAVQRPVTTPSSFPPLTRALWAAVKTCEGNHYIITHAQPFDQKQQRSSLPLAAGHDLEQPDEDSAGYTTLHLGTTTSSMAVSNTENQMYYCCTDLMMMQQTPTSSGMQQVTSLDDSANEICCEGSQNPLYVNMSPLHPLSSPKMNYPLINPIYPSPCRPQQMSTNVSKPSVEENTVRNNHLTHQTYATSSCSVNVTSQCSQS